MSEGQLSSEFARQSKLQSNKESNVAQLVQTNQTLATQLEKLILENRALKGSIKGSIIPGTQMSRKSDALGESGFSFAAEELLAHGSGVLLRNPAVDIPRPQYHQRNPPNLSISEDRIFQSQDHQGVAVKPFQDSDANVGIPNKSNASNATAEIRSALELTESQHRIERLESQNQLLKDSLAEMEKVRQENSELSGKLMNYQMKLNKAVAEHQEELNRTQAKLAEAEQERIKTLNSLMQLLADNQEKKQLIEAYEAKLAAKTAVELHVQTLIPISVEGTGSLKTHGWGYPAGAGYLGGEYSVSGQNKPPRMKVIGGVSHGSERVQTKELSSNPSNWQVEEVDRPHALRQQGTQEGGQNSYLQHPNLGVSVIREHQAHTIHGALKHPNDGSRSGSKKRVSFNEAQQSENQTETAQPESTAHEPRSLVFIMADGTRVSAEEYDQYKTKRMEAILKETQKVVVRSEGILSGALIKLNQSGQHEQPVDTLEYEEHNYTREKKKKKEKKHSRPKETGMYTAEIEPQGMGYQTSYSMPAGFTGTHLQIDERTRVHFPENYLRAQGDQQSSVAYNPPRSFIAEQHAEVKPPAQSLDSDEQFMREIVERGFNRLKQEQLAAVNEQKLIHTQAGMSQDYLYRQQAPPEPQNPMHQGASQFASLDANIRLPSALTSFSSTGFMSGAASQNPAQAQPSTHHGIDTLRLIKDYQQLTHTPGSLHLHSYGHSHTGPPSRPFAR